MTVGPEKTGSRPKAYESIAVLLRERIIGGELASGDRLPNELVLAEEYGVSRATVREALRLLTAQDIIRTSKGAGGGSYVRVPRVDRINDFLQSSIDLLSVADHVTIDELLEARALLEVPAARLAAERRSEQDLESLRAAIPPGSAHLDLGETFVQNREFHTVVLRTCGNALLAIAAEPIFGVLMRNVARSTFTPRFNRRIGEQHLGITTAIEAADSDRAGELMFDHLEFLRPVYAKAWRRATRRPG